MKKYSDKEILKELHNFDKKAEEIGAELSRLSTLYITDKKDLGIIVKSVNYRGE